MLLLHKIGKQSNRRSTPDFAVEAAVLDGFGNVVTIDVFRRSEVGDSSGDFEDAVISASAELQIFHRLAKKV